MIVNTLGNVEIEPVFIGQALRIPALAHIRVTTSWNFFGFSLSIETFMLSLEIFFHELFAEDLASHVPRSQNPSHYELEHNQDNSESYISVKIELFLVSEEHQEEGNGRIGVKRCLLRA
jgi:hypothetical protein